eukprot:SAG31_NODE_16036_length_726_cov_1.202552_1_plen_210_part_01
MLIATGEVHARLASPTASLSVRTVLAPDENTVLSTVVAEPPMKVTVTTWVLPGGDTSAGIIRGNTFWAQRQPSGMAKPIGMTMASVVTVCGTAAAAAAAATQTCTRTSEVAAACVVQAGGRPLHVTTVVRSNLDNCPGYDAPSSVCPMDPVLNATARASAASASTAATSALEAANQRWWASFWNASFVELPGDATLERYFYAHSYLIGSA